MIYFKSFGDVPVGSVIVFEFQEKNVTGCLYKKQNSNSNFIAYYSLKLNDKIESIKGFSPLAENFKTIRNITCFESDSLYKALPKTEAISYVNKNIRDPIIARLKNLSDRHFVNLMFIFGNQDKGSTISLLLKDVVLLVTSINNSL